MKDRFSVSPGALILGGLVFYLSTGRTLRLLLCPVLFHELGHLLAVFLSGCRLTAFRVEISGLCLCYTGTTAPWQDAVIAAAGPLAGAFYALVVRSLGDDGALSAGISLLLTLFNLLPIRPLDGWHITSALLGGRKAAHLSILAAIVLWAAGLLGLLHGYGAALLLSGCLLLLSQGNRPDPINSTTRSDRRCE